MTYRFGPYRADRTAYRVFRGEEALELTPKLLDLLFYLLDRPATLVTKEELLDGVWPGANVTDNALAQAVSELREAIGDEPASPTFIKTVARRGYRFVAEVSAESAPAPARSDPAVATVSPATAPAGDQQAIIVLDFTNVTGETDVGWLAAGIAETVTSDLAALGHFRVIDRWSVVQAGRGSDGSMQQIGAAFGATLAVTGSYQRNGPRLRITARVVDLRTGAAVADAKVDGALDDVFALQDRIVKTFAHEMGVSVSPTARRSVGRETASLDAYRAYIEGVLKVESLETALVEASIADFERSIGYDAGYALAHTGLANAAFVAHEMTRAQRSPNTEALAAGIEHARRAIRLDPKLAEAHATLSFLLVSRGQLEDARQAAQQAVAIEPDNWRHQYRLGHALWGSARLRAFESAIALYPQFPYAHFEMTMVHVATGRLDLAEQIARQGIEEQDRQTKPGHRFPAVGFHWLLGALEATRGRFPEAVTEFNRELGLIDVRRLYGHEYGAMALTSRGMAELAMGRAAQAIASFREARSHVTGFGRAHLGEALALEAQGDKRGAAAARQEAIDAVRDYERSGRIQDAHFLGARIAASAGKPAEVAKALNAMFDAGPPSFHGWTIPIDPFLAPVADRPEFRNALARLQERAR